MITREQVRAIANTIFVLDTNNLLDYPGFLDDLTAVGSQESPLRLLAVIPRVVLREIDGLKRSENGWGFQAREFSRQLERFVHRHPRNALGAHCGDCTVFIDQETELTLGADLRQLDPDEILLRVARRYQEDFGDIAGVTLCTADRNLGILARQAGIGIANLLDWGVTADKSLFNPNLPRSMPFHLHQETTRTFPFPGVLGRAETGWLGIWPGQGYQGGEVREYHLAYEEGDYRSPTLVLAAGPVRASPVREGPYTVADFHFADRDHPRFAYLPLANQQMVRVTSNRCGTRPIQNGTPAREQRYFTELALHIQVTTTRGQLQLVMEDEAAADPAAAAASPPASVKVSTGPPRNAALIAVGMVFLFLCGMAGVFALLWSALG